jgi:DNA replication and repair protein RecF
MMCSPNWIPPAAALLEAVGESHQCLVSATHLEGFGGGWQQQAQILGARDLRPDLKIG